MSDQTIIRHCSPTLAGLKTGSLFSAGKETREKLIEEIRKLNGILKKKGLRAIAFESKCGKQLIYIYRPALLKRDLSSDDAINILKDKGYSTENCDICIAQLAKRLRQDTEFPHEIGLFLGYPPFDVKSFMNNSRENVKQVGCWKVYGDEEEAVKKFALYRKCTEIYSRKIDEGVSLEKLIV